MVHTAIHTRILAYPLEGWIRIVQTLSLQKNEPFLDKRELNSLNPSPSHQRQMNPATGKTHPPRTQAQIRRPPTRDPIFLRTKPTSHLPFHQKAQLPHTQQRTTSYHHIHHLILLPGIHHLFKLLKPRSPLLDNYNRP